MKQLVCAKSFVAKASLLLFVATACCVTIYAAIITTDSGNCGSALTASTNDTNKTSNSISFTSVNKGAGTTDPYKSTASLAVFRTADLQPNISVELLLASDISNKSIADGFSVYFSDQYSASIGEDDSYKFTNLDENVAVVRNGKTLSIEGRPLVAGADTVAMKMWQLSQSNYTLRVSKSNFGDNVEAYLHDAYFHSSSVLGDGENLIPFKITSDAASAAPDRFTIILKTIAALPVNLTEVKAFRKNKGAEVDWTAESESNLDKYEVQRSVSAAQFETVGVVSVNGNSGGTSHYSFFDPKPLAGDNYYRIKSVEKARDAKYSEVVRVRFDNAGSFNVFPNPVTGNTINLTISNPAKGEYVASLLKSDGQKVYSTNITHNGGSANYTIKVGAIAKGMYDLIVASKGGVQKIKILLQ